MTKPKPKPPVPKAKTDETMTGTEGAGTETAGTSGGETTENVGDDSGSDSDGDADSGDADEAGVGTTEDLGAVTGTGAGATTTLQPPDPKGKGKGGKGPQFQPTVAPLKGAKRWVKLTSWLGGAGPGTYIQMPESQAKDYCHRSKGGDLMKEDFEPPAE